MIHRPELAGQPEGAIVTIDGRLMRHLGEGRFALAEELLTKRFANDEGETLHRVA